MAKTPTAFGVIRTEFTGNIDRDTNITEEDFVYPIQASLLGCRGGVARSLSLYY